MLMEKTNIKSIKVKEYIKVISTKRNSIAFNPSQQNLYSLKMLRRYTFLRQEKEVT